MSGKPKSCIARSAKGAVAITPLGKAALAAWKKKAPKAQAAWVASTGFAADSGTVALLPGTDGALGEVLWGLGAEKSAPEEPWAYAALAAALPGGTYAIGGRLSAKAAFAAALGWSLAHYGFERYSSAGLRPPRRLALPKGVDATRLKALVEGMTLGRDLVNTPAEDMGPTELAAAARTLARKAGARLSITTGKDLEAKFPAVHAVGRAAHNAPRLIDLRWGKPGDPKVTLVGKGVCFDSGGLDIKNAVGMRLMKKDMGGAATALGLASAIMAAGLKVRLRVVIPAVENAIAGNAYRPGDIVRTRKGLSVEIGNTDAEGRIVLSDALALADEEAPDLLIDFATLTGAARVALGGDLPALYTADDKLAAALADCGTAAADPLWRMPLWQPYMETLKSDIADLSNVSNNAFAGSVTAALFLSRFVEKAKHWVHLDIYGWNGTARPGRPLGGEATALRAVFAYLEGRYGR